MSTLTGIPKDDIKGVGGIYTAYACLLSDITGTTTQTDGVADFHAGADVFKKYVLPKESGSNFVYTQTGDLTNGTSIWDDVFTMIFRRNQVSKRNEAKVLAEQETVWVIMDNTQATSSGSCSMGNTYVIGLPICLNQGGVEARTIVGTTGAQSGEGNLMTVTVGVNEHQPPLGISETTWNAIVAGEAF